MSSIELPDANLEAVAALGDPTMPGTLLYEYTPQVTRLVEYGASADALFSGRTPPPAEGARFDLYLEGPVEGPNAFPDPPLPAMLARLPAGREVRFATACSP
jgi:hypothetical protein